MSGPREGRAYYNEIDRFCCDWLSNLMDAGHIMPGRIDDRSIAEVASDDVRGFARVHLFAGIAGWERALALAGWPPRRPVWTGSCPCQPFSNAGKRLGHDDSRHLWPDLRRLVGECRPAIVFGEQVASPLGRAWLTALRADLEGLGYAVGAADLPAAGAGAPHIRQRLWWVAHGDGEQQSVDDGGGGGERMAAGQTYQPGGGRPYGGLDHADRIGCERGAARSRKDVPAERRATEGSGASHWSRVVFIPCADGRARPIKPGILPLADGLPGRMGRLRAYGNAIVPQVAAAFIEAAAEVPAA